VATLGSNVKKSSSRRAQLRAACDTQRTIIVLLLDLVGDEGQALRFEELDLLIRESHRTRPRAYYLQRVPVMRQVLINDGPRLNFGRDDTMSKPIGEMIKNHVPIGEMIKNHVPLGEFPVKG
jgi:hypothetical protein